MEVLEYFVNKCCGNVSLLSKVKQNHLQTIKARVFIRGDDPAKSANTTTMKSAAVPPVLWKPASPCSAPQCQQSQGILPLVPIPAGSDLLPLPAADTACLSASPCLQKPQLGGLKALCILPGSPSEPHGPHRYFLPNFLRPVMPP